jgi:hypothetical protein
VAVAEIELSSPIQPRRSRRPVEAELARSAASVSGRASVPSITSADRRAGSEHGETFMLASTVVTSRWQPAEKKVEHVAFFARAPRLAFARSAEERDSCPRRCVRRARQNALQAS